MFSFGLSFALAFVSRGRLIVFSSVFADLECNKDKDNAFTVRSYLLKRRPPCRRIVSSTHASPQGTDSTAICKCPPLNDPLYHVTVVDTADECEAYLVNRGLCQPLVLGLDCEWCNRPRRSDVDSLQDIPVALLQLAFPNGECLLVRLCKIRKVTPTLERLLTDKSILKFGVGIAADSVRLFRGFGVQVAGCVDLQPIATRSGVRGSTSLKGLASQLLGVELDKSPRLRCSNWEADVLSREQVRYAAADAYVALHILKALVHMKISRQDKRETAAGGCVQLASTYSPTGTPMEAVDGYQQVLYGQDVSWLLQEGSYSCLLSLCQGIVDVTYKQSRRHSAPAGQQQPGYREDRRRSAYSMRKKPLYDNCLLLAPDGALLSTVDQRKLDWYMRRGLGSMVSESPPTMKLHFEPAGRPKEDRKYYLLEKENVCVVCGSGSSCVRKNIVPHEYRRLFPPHLKDHMSHDILLMCVGCHQRANQYDAALRQRLAVEAGAPLNVSSQKYSEDPWLLRVRNHARALAKTTSIPAWRREDLLGTLSQHFGCGSHEITDEHIKQASEINPRSSNSEYVSHAEIVMGRLKEDDDIVEFTKRWRQHFLESMNPQFLPELWCVDHNPRT